jgi:hypothetical protein
MSLWKKELTQAETTSAGFRSNRQGKSGEDRHDEIFMDKGISTRTNADNGQDNDLAELKV